MQFNCIFVVVGPEPLPVCFILPALIVRRCFTAQASASRRWPRPALLLESTLTRLLAVTQYYHFAFLVVSLALLGFGASGTFLSLRKTQTPNPHIYRLAGAGFAAGTLLAYTTVNWLPFDSYTIAWERRQLLYFALHYLILALPFFCSGVGIGAGLVIGGGRASGVHGEPVRGGAGRAAGVGGPGPRRRRTTGEASQQQKKNDQGQTPNHLAYPPLA